MKEPNIMSAKSFAKLMNDTTFTNYYLRLKMLAKSCYHWENLPNNINERHIENLLYEHGECVFFKDPMLGFIVSEFTSDGNTNHYGDPVCVRPTAPGIEQRTLIVGEDCVIIRNNDERLATDFFIKEFAYRLAHIKRTIDVNVNAQKTPYILAGTDKEILTLKNIYTKVEANELAIYLNKNFDLQNVAVLKLDAPIVFTQLNDQITNEWNEALTFLGINNANTDKKERLITNEVDANNVHIDLSGECFLKTRTSDKDAINSLFELNIGVMRRDGGACKCGDSDGSQEVQEDDDEQY